MTTHGARRRAHPVDSDSLSIQFDGRSLDARSTDTIASALIANGVRVFGTHPHDGSPRGGFCFVGRCSDCLMVVDGQPGVMACSTLVHADMTVETQIERGHWPAGYES